MTDVKASHAGISLRIIREYQPETHHRFDSTVDKAMMLAMADEREITFAEKFAEAVRYLKRLIH